MIVKMKKEGKNHSKKSKVIMIIVALTLLTYIGFAVYINWPITAILELNEINVSDIPLVARDTPAPSFNLRSVNALPSSDGSGVRDLRFFDLTNADLSNNTTELGLATFSSNTIWPANTPNDFSPEEILILGKNPGLGVRSLHERGITGEGVGIAIIDFNLLSSHEQYADSLRLYELYRTINQTAVMHGPVVASVAVGEDTGVAPKADLFFIATMWGAILPPFAIPSYSRIVSSIERILEINNYLPESERIRVISISRGFALWQPGANALRQVIDRANEQGVFVITTFTEHNFDFYLRGLSREPMADPDEISSYTLGLLFTNDRNIDTTNHLFVPTDSRTVASHTGDADYIFLRRGGNSLATPWLAGLYALCVQVYPNITPELFITIAFETGDVLHRNNYTLGTIVNPVRLIEALERRIGL